jgi:sugar phosphate isomerase/epimerase
MKLGYLTKFSEDELKRASGIGFDGLEAHAGSWGDDVLQSADARKSAAKQAKDLSDKCGVSITAIANYQGGMAPAADRIARFKNVIGLASEMGVGVIAALTGGDGDKDLAENVALWAETFREVAKVAESSNVKIAFENWPGLGLRLPVRSNNFGFNPPAWEAMFDAVPSEALGLEFDPSHLVWQSADYLKIARKFGSRIYHVHFKDTEIKKDLLAENGFFSGGWWRYRIPGFGLVDWAGFMSVLREVGFDGGGAIEHEDGVFQGDKWEEGLRLGYNHLRPLIVKK